MQEVTSMALIEGKTGVAINPLLGSCTTISYDRKIENLVDVGNPFISQQS